VRIEIRDQRLFIVHRQHPGLGGYPLGSLEQTLVLMSGGFDSTVAAYQMMRRGLMTHFCFFNLGGGPLSVAQVRPFAAGAVYQCAVRGSAWRNFTVTWA
jgi:adenylyl- and sulfurtransferase ThiI